MFGYRNEELEARWYQLGAFSPINRLHSSNSPFSGKEPWNFNRDVSAAMVDALRLRHAMMPYLYTMNYRAAEAGRPLVEPMYWQNPDTPDAYEVPDEFRFGTELVVAPIVSPGRCRPPAAAAPTPGCRRGSGSDFFDGRRYVSSDAAGRRLEVWRSLDRTPVFAKPARSCRCRTSRNPAKRSTLSPTRRPCACWCSLVPTARSSCARIAARGAPPAPTPR